MDVVELIAILNQIIDDPSVEVCKDTPLVGINSIIDSMSLVQLCLALEEKATDYGFEFDWTSEKAMSSVNSVFRTPETLCQEFNSQKSGVSN